MTGHQGFVLSHTAIASPAAVPEIRLHLATEATPLWEATEAFLAERDLPPPYWAFAWVGGQATARWLLDHPEVVRGRSVLDFAAGCGIGAVAAGLAGAARIEAAEIDPFALAAIRLNAGLNGVAVHLSEGDVVAGPDGGWDVVLAGDVCYERPMAELIFPWLRRLASRGAQVILADPGRAYLPRTGLMRLASYPIPTSLDLEDREMREGVVYRIVG